MIEGLPVLLDYVMQVSFAQDQGMVQAFTPELRPFRELIDLPAVERLALIYVAPVYERRAAVRI